MNNGFVISPDVLNTISSLPEQERLSIVCALAGEMLLGIKRDNGLSPMEKVIYTIIRQYIRRDTERAAAAAV